MSCIWNILIIALIIIVAIILICIICKICKKKKFKPSKDRCAQEDKLNHDLKPYGFAYESCNDYFYSRMDGWQRKYGYCTLYDDAMPFTSMIVDSEPIRFEYNHKKWLIEFWKGQYGMTTGAEVGVYYSRCKEIDIAGFKGTFYESVPNEEMLPISIILRKNGKVLMKRSGIHWWMTGFILGEFSQPEELTVEIDITFPDMEMSKAFINALLAAGYGRGDISVSMRKVSILFSKPYTKQPVTRNKVQTKLAQKNNKRNCKLYKRLTKKYVCTLDKIEYLEKKAPILYKVLLKSIYFEAVFKDYNLLEPFIKEEC